MKGDKLIIQKGHIKAAGHLMRLLLPRIIKTRGRFIITIAGESGSGKSEIAAVLSGLLSKMSIKSIILQQDDYFVYPPKTNAAMRRKDIGHVGLSEVRLALFDRNLREIMEGKKEISKPLVIFDEDRITKETVKLEGIKVIMAEGTYTSLLKNVHQRIFIARIYLDTRKIRKKRAREKQDEFLEKVLKIEHNILLSHKPRGDIFITKDYKVKRNDEKQQN